MTCVSVCPRFDGSVTSPVSPMFGPCLLHRNQIRTVARKDPTRYKISSPSFPTSSVSTVMVTATSLMIPVLVHPRKSPFSSMALVLDSP